MQPTTPPPGGRRGSGHQGKPLSRSVSRSPTILLGACGPLERRPEDDLPATSCRQCLGGDHDEMASAYFRRVVGRPAYRGRDRIRRRGLIGVAGPARGNLLRVDAGYHCRTSRPRPPPEHLLTDSGRDLLSPGRYRLIRSGSPLPLPLRSNITGYQDRDGRRQSRSAWRQRRSTGARVLASPQRAPRH